MIAIADYGVGNLFSLKSSFAAIGHSVAVTSDADTIRSADRIILPGVGAYRDAARKLEESGLGQVIKEEAASGKPLLGSYEYGEYKGLGIIPGEIMPIAGVIPEDLKIPHIGWNSLDLKRESPLFVNIKNGDHVYFVHSYYACTSERYVLATSEYGADLTAVVALDNVYGCQFHPEKSGKTGLSILKAFCEET